MDLEAAVSADTFDVFAVECTLNGADGQVVINRNIEVIDENGQIIGKTTVADFQHEFGASAQYGQALVVDGTTYEIGRQYANDGFIVSYEVHKR